MLGSSNNKFDQLVFDLTAKLNPKTIFELGCGKGKYVDLIRDPVLESAKITAVQKLFNEDDEPQLTRKGYSKVIDTDILEYVKSGFDERYDLIVALDVLEHFLLYDALSIIHFCLYRAKHVLLVWPTCHPQDADSSPFDRHRSSFNARNLMDVGDLVFYAKTGFADLSVLHQYNVAVLSGHMNIETFRI